jgi:hypothetical protein
VANSHALDTPRLWQSSAACCSGAYTNRAGIAVSSARDDSAGAAANAGAKQDHSDFSREARSTWARLLRKIFEADPLVCACGARMRIVSFIVDPCVVDRILRHRESERCQARDPFESRAPVHLKTAALAPIPAVRQKTSRR